MMACQIMIDQIVYRFLTCIEAGMDVEAAKKKSSDKSDDAWVSFEAALLAADELREIAECPPWVTSNSLLLVVGDPAVVLTHQEFDPTGAGFRNGYNENL